MLEPIISLIQCLMYITACLFLGLIIIKYTIKNDNKTLPVYFKFTNAFLLGLGTLTYILLCIGLLHLFSFIILLIIICIILLSGIYLLHINLYELYNKKLINEYRESPVSHKIIFLITSITFIIIEIRAIIFQPLGDSTAYYLVLPKLIASSQYLTPLPGYEVMSRMSMFSEIHYAALISLGTPIAAKIFIGIVFISAILVLFQIGNKINLNLFGKYILLALIITSSALTEILFEATVDWFAAAFGLLAIYWALEFSEKNENSVLVLTGLFSGFAILGKISYAYTFFPIIIFLLFWKYVSLDKIKENLKPVLKTGIIFVSSMFIPIILNMIKNYILFNQPFAPLFTPTEYSSGLYQIWYTPINALWIIITYPFALAFGAYPMQGGTLSPLYLALLPLIFFIKDSITFNKITICTIIGIISSIIITPFIFAPRYLLIPLILLLLIIAKSTQFYILHTKKYINKIIILFIILVISIILISSLYDISSTIKQGECDKIGSICYASQILNTQTKTGDKIYILGYYTYWLNENLLINLSGASERNYIETTLKSPNERIEYLNNKNYKYIFSDGSFTNATQKYLLQNSSQNLNTTIIFSNRNINVFKINNLTKTL